MSQELSDVNVRLHLKDEEIEELGGRLLALANNHASPESNCHGFSTTSQQSKANKLVARIIISYNIFIIIIIACIIR